MALQGMLLYLQFLDEFLQVALGALLRHDLEHLLADAPHLSSLGVASRLRRLIRLLLREADAEDPEVVSVGGPHVDEGFDQRLPLADQRAELIPRHVHPVEVRDHVVALDILADQSDLPVCLRLVAAVEVRQRELEDTTLETLRGDLCTDLG